MRYLESDNATKTLVISTNELIIAKILYFYRRQRDSGFVMNGRDIISFQIWAI
jgi:hypothetical protein